MEESKRRGLEQEDNKVVAVASGDDDDMGEDIVAWLSSVEGDDSMSELMKILETTETNSPIITTGVKFIDNPYSFSMIFQSSSSYITINGNEESCGSSFSDSDSSVMASVDMGGVNIGTNIISFGGCCDGKEEWRVQALEAGNRGGACGSKEEEARGRMVEENGNGMSSDGSVGFDWKWDFDVGDEEEDVDVVLGRFNGDDKV